MSFLVGWLIPALGCQDIGWISAPMPPMLGCLCQPSAAQLQVEALPLTSPPVCCDMPVFQNKNNTDS